MIKPNIKRIIGLAGPKGVGKTTIARAILDETPGVVLSFATPIRDALTAMGLSVPDYHRDKDKPLINGHSLRDLSYRDLMKSLGTEWGRDMVSPDIWVNLALENLEDQLAESPFFHGGNATVVVDDVRMDNEAERIRDLGGSVYELFRDGFTTFTGDHATEQGINSDLISQYVNSADAQQAALNILHTYDGR